MQFSKEDKILKSAWM